MTTSARDEIGRSSGARSLALHLVFALSGIAGLGYQIVWLRSFSVGLGHEAPGMLAVIAAFFVGLALGAWGLDRAVSRSRAPGAWYAWLEVLIGAWAVGSVWLIPWVNWMLPGWIGVEPTAMRHWLIAFGVPALVLLPATAAMGATLPAMDRFVARLVGSGGAGREALTSQSRSQWHGAPTTQSSRRWHGSGHGSVVGGLYAANTVGAMLGTIGATFVLLPTIGVRATTLVFAAINIACAAAVMVMARGHAASEEAPSPAVVEERDGAAIGRGRLLLTLALTGMLGIGFEVLGTRVLARALENTVYTFAAVLTVYLFGTALGAAVFQRFLQRFEPSRVIGGLLAALSSCVLLGVLMMSASASIYESARGAFGGGFAGSIGAELTVAAFVYLPATMCMGALFSALARAMRSAAGGVGLALAVNTLAGALGPAVFGVVLLPMVGAQIALIGLGLAYLLALPRVSARSLPMVIVPMALAAFAWGVDLRLVQPREGGRVLEFREGILGATAVVTDAADVRYLKVNNRFSMGGGVGLFAERRMGHLPMLQHPDPRRVLFLGVGTGITMSSALAHSGASATGVELVPEVIDVLPMFAPQSGFDGTGGGGGARVLAADARRYVGASGDLYDVVVADLFHPHQDGAGSLYTREHFEAVRARLAPGGVFCQWLPLHQLDDEMIRVIVRTYLSVFPDARAFLAAYNVETPLLGLMSGGVWPPPPDWWATRVAEPGLASALELVAMRDELSLIGSFVGDAAALRAFAGEGEINTDDRPAVIYSAPRFAYRADEPPHARLMRLLESVRPNAAALVAADDPGWKRVLSRRYELYFSARDLYLKAAVADRAGSRSAAIDLYLESVRTSREFPTSQAVLRQFIAELSAADQAASEALKKRLDEAMARK